MRRLPFVCIVLFFSFISLFSRAQHATPDEQLAAQYYQNKEFDKAVVYYEKLFNKKPSPLYYTYYLNCLIELKDFKEAEKTIRKLIKQNPLGLNFIVDLGNIYILSNEPSKAKNEFQRAIKELSPNQGQILSLADAFKAIRQWDFAIATLHRGRKLLQGYYSFHFEIAEVYWAKGDIASMINEYLDVLELSPSYIQNVQNALQISFDSKANRAKNEIIKNELLKRIQRSADNSIFSELLIWMFVQQRDFESALTQAKALDRRRREAGERIFSLAQLAASNDFYDVAIKAYEYILERGSQNFNYISAKMGILEVMFKKVVDKGDYSMEELVSLELKYKNTISELGKFSGTVPLMKSLAHIQAFYLNKNKEAIDLLEETIIMPQISATLQAECKLELGDLLLLSGDVWEASLRYSQVEKAFKHDAIGQEAKFRNAKIAYYTGDFKWSQAQLDVLKAATSKLIANDAMYLSLLILDNTGIDTNSVPLLMYSNAELLSFQNKDEQALMKLDSINILFPSHSLADDILFTKFKILNKNNKPLEASLFLQKIIDDYSTDILVDDALFKLAELYESKLNNIEKAQELYQELITKHPGSLYTVEARKRFRNLRGDKIN